MTRHAAGRSEAIHGVIAAAVVCLPLRRPRGRQPLVLAKASARVARRAAHGRPPATLLADTEAVGAPEPQPLPRLWLQDTVVLRVGVLANTPGWVESWSLVVPPGLLGTLLLVQGGALSPLARNGVYATTHAHAFVLQ